MGRPSKAVKAVASLRQSLFILPICVHFEVAMIKEVVSSVKRLIEKEKEGVLLVFLRKLT